ncbi:ATP-binding protein [Cellulomonas shaoxiangyii]|uniref:ATP-binding protein n=1 Tax=Cellulomonas shaoxiangyii TaxID=2566013 RepID=UPI001408CBC6|nr:helix-turn-helix domain-containing protein [Cellulomonas shaoxiangyii]
MQPPTRPEDQEFARLLIAAREHRGMSQESLAERSGVSVRAIRDLERGRVGRPRRQSAQLLAAGLGLAGARAREFLAAAGVAADPGTTSDGFCSLPPPPVLAGRQAELAALVAGVSAHDDGRPGGVVLISGQPGVGKTAVAVAAGYALADRFPDGQLFVSLHGADAAPLSPADALGQVLVALGAGPGLPTRLEERTALYRAQLHRRRVLLVLDDAASEAQVRQLLPVGGSLALVTARRRLAGLHVTDRVFLDVLDEAGAGRMVESIVGSQRCDAEPEAVGLLTAACGRLPLALRVAANRLASRPHWTLRQLVDRLADERRRLSELKAGDLSVRGPFEMSYGQLSGRAATLFRRLALLATGEFDGGLSAPLLGTGRCAADGPLDELVEASLIESTGPDRYRLHDLTRIFAACKLTADPASERDAARLRLDDFVLVTTIRAGAHFDADETVQTRLRRWDGGWTPGSRDEAARWLALESAQWLASLHRAAHEGRYALVVDVCEAMHWYSDRHHAAEVWPQVFTLGVQAARAGGLRAHEAQQRNYLGWALHICAGRRTAAVAEHESARAIAREAGDRKEEAWALMYLSWLQVREEPDEAIARCRDAVRLMAGARHVQGTAHARFYLGVVLHEAGRFAEAEDELREAEDGHLAQLVADGADVQAADGLGFVRLWRARNLLRLDSPQPALRKAQEAADGFREQRNPRGLARALLAAAEADAQQGDLRGAIRRLDVAADLFAQLAATRFEAESLLVAADLYERVGRRDRALATWERASELAAQIEGEQGRLLRERASRGSTAP